MVYSCVCYLVPLVDDALYDRTLAAATEALRRSGLVAAEGPLGLALAGELDEIFAAVKAAQGAAVAAGARQVDTTLALSNACPCDVG